MKTDLTNEVFILGVTLDGKTFRPSDWAERLAGVMSQFRPGGAKPGNHLGYSPWCIPTTLEGITCVVVHRDLRENELLAWDFCLNFARDNQLQIREGRVAQLDTAHSERPQKKPSFDGFSYFADSAPVTNGAVLI